MRILIAFFLTLSASSAAFAQQPPVERAPTPIADELTRVSDGGALRASARRPDPLWNGAVIGAGTAIAAGLLLCTAMEPWENCRDDVGPMVRIGALGAAIGVGIDALIQRRFGVDFAGRQVVASPLVSRRGGGVRVAVRF